MNKGRIYRKYTISRIFEIVAGLVFLLFGLGSIYYNQADSFNQKCSFISGIIGIFLVLFGIFYKVKITNNALTYMFLIPLKRIPLLDVENIEIETKEKDFHLIFKYKDGITRKISNIWKFKYYDKLIQDLENVIKQKDVYRTNIEHMEQKNTNITLMFLFYVFIILFSLILTCVVSYYFIITLNKITNNLVLTKFSVIIVFTICFSVIFNLFLFILEKKDR